MTDYGSMGEEGHHMHRPPGLDGDVDIGYAASSSPKISVYHRVARPGILSVLR